MENNNLTLDEYQQLALETAIYPNPIIYIKIDREWINNN